jgi:hypothetical protein
MDIPTQAANDNAMSEAGLQRLIADLFKTKRTPVDYFLSVIRDQTQPQEERLQAAIEAAPYVHSPARRAPRSGRAARPKPGDPISLPAPTIEDVVWRKHRGLSPLEYLVEVANDPTAPRERQREAEKVARPYLWAVNAGLATSGGILNDGQARAMKAFRQKIRACLAEHRAATSEPTA